MDLLADQLSNGRRFRVLNIVDDFSRELVGQLIGFFDLRASGRSISRPIGCHKGVAENDHHG